MSSQDLYHTPLEQLQLDLNQQLLELGPLVKQSSFRINEAGLEINKTIRGGFRLNMSLTAGAAKALQECPQLAQLGETGAGAGIVLTISKADQIIQQAELAIGSGEAPVALLYLSIGDTNIFSIDHDQEGLSRAELNGLREREQTGYYYTSRMLTRMAGHPVSSGW